MYIVSYYITNVFLSSINTTKKTYHLEVYYFLDELIHVGYWGFFVWNNLELIWLFFDQIVIIIKYIYIFKRGRLLWARCGGPGGEKKSSTYNNSRRGQQAQPGYSTGSGVPAYRPASHSRPFFSSIIIYKMAVFSSFSFIFVVRGEKIHCT